VNGILVLSHSAQAARGIAEIASQMGGPDVPIAACGGTEDGGLGTSVTEVLAALEDLLSRAEGVLVVPDLGSAVLTARTALEILGERANRVMIADGPILEGAFMAAVAALMGGSLEGLAAVVEEAAGLKKLP
jgi:dihydroxyacetone kinase phosphotransfer subunit